MHPKTLVTGGAGFIGSHLCKCLLDAGHEVTILDNLFTGNKENIYELLNNPRCTFVLADVTQPIAGQFDFIINLACPASPIHYQKNPLETMRTSVFGVHNVLDLALRTGAVVLHASTSEVYGDPLQHPQTENYWGNVNTIGVRSCYDEGKRAAETLCADYWRVHGVDVRVVRIFNTYGPHMHPADGRVISNVIMQCLRGDDITVYGNGTQTRSFQYVSDLVDVMTQLLSMDKQVLYDHLQEHNWLQVPLFNTGNPDEFTILSLVEQVKTATKSSSEIIYQPLPQDDPQQRKPDITLAQNVLGWQPKVQLQEGLQSTIAYFEQLK